ncbi:heterokaryon incompatibility protein-domain-containing protein [Annulohypoxylon truncatum]|uniref:heterokaryon incompatibility protein-domain-containing protein n=1 Tax=Annulohypoxylon truncatum TaxID=327061 RepID=UPI00200792E6|nr:heterokaryon incompatibility protein-domain-containing protein [Annulohypoxylon truncatum]KAI1207497.1 heterokaryon incompatibility protein-domain-containing protein [Annulohypoxylon truncatum]
MEEQPPSVPQIVLPDGWNSISPGSSSFLGPVCEGCGWDGDPLGLLGGFGYVNLKALCRRDCIRCQIIALLIETIIRRKREHISYQSCMCFFHGNHIVFVGQDASHFCKKVFLFTSTHSHKTEVPRGIPSSPPERIDTSTDASLLWAQEQIAGHQHCCQPVGADSFVPTRLINVDPNSLNGDVALDDCAPTGSRYVALSYCWGRKTQPCQTTSLTLPYHKKRIPWSTLPKTIRDAIDFTRKLGIGYLWVDCLCIVQGDKEDWERESGRMFDVYRSSYVTLAAVWGKDSNSGLFSSSEGFKPILLANLCLNNQSWPLYMRRYHEPISSQYLSRTGKYPLFTRAWAYQERLIPPRVLYFTAGELAFECFCHSACECGLQYSDLAGHPRRILFEATQTPTKSIGPRAQSNEIAFRNQWLRETHAGIDGDQVTWSSRLTDSQKAWWGMVYRYSCLDLTNVSDKLPAIGAIARQFQTVRPGERYLAGLWSGSLHRDLLWYTRGVDCQRLETAPTWSWASISGFVDPNLGPTDEVILSVEVLDATCCYVDDNPFGVFKSGFLTLRGRLTPCWLREHLRDRVLGTVYHWRSGLIITSDVRIDVLSKVLSCKLLRRVYLLEVGRGAGRNSRERYLLILGRKSKVHQKYFRMGILIFRPDLWFTGHGKSAGSMNTALDRYSPTKTITLI